MSARVHVWACAHVLVPSVERNVMCAGTSARAAHALTVLLPPPPPLIPTDPLQQSNAGKILGIYPKDWARITAILLTLYVCLGMIYWGLLEAGVHVRGTDWLTLSGRFYGKFIENTQPAVPDHEYDSDTMVRSPVRGRAALPATFAAEALVRKSCVQRAGKRAHACASADMDTRTRPDLCLCRAARDPSRSLRMRLPARPLARSRS